jgi:hypothetical protein
MYSGGAFSIFVLVFVPCIVRPFCFGLDGRWSRGRDRMLDAERKGDWGQSTVHEAAPALFNHLHHWQHWHVR